MQTRMRASRRTRPACRLRTDRFRRPTRIHSEDADWIRPTPKKRSGRRRKKLVPQKSSARMGQMLPERVTVIETRTIKTRRTRGENKRRCPNGMRKIPARPQRTVPPRILSRSQFKPLKALEDTMQLFPRPRDKNKAQVDAAVQGRPQAR